MISCTDGTSEAEDGVADRTDGLPDRGGVIGGVRMGAGIAQVRLAGGAQVQVGEAGD